MIQKSAVSVNPILFEDGNKWDRTHWFALYARSRHEKLADRELRNKGIETFLPLRKITHQWSDRKIIVEEPLFKGYLFVNVSLKNRFCVLNTRGAVRFVGPRPSEPSEVPARDIGSIRRFIEEKIKVDPFPYVKEGTRVYVCSGPFRGIEGFVVRKDNHCRLVMSVDLLMQSVSVQVDEACVQPL
jgi:transcription antitermination factor NusG